MSSARVAENLRDSLKFLDISPLRFQGDTGESAEDDLLDGHIRYVERPGTPRSGGRKPSKVMEDIKLRLQLGRDDAKIFLSGHVGSGKSTELERLAAYPDIQKQFFTIFFRFEEAEWAYLNSAQILFRIAAELFEKGRKEKLLSEENNWNSHLQELNKVYAKPSGLEVKEGTVGVEWNLFFAKIKQELKLSSHHRQKFREFGETHQTLLQDLIEALTKDITKNLAQRGDGRSLLMIVDDLDKVREEENIDDIFERNLDALLRPPLRLLCTLPISVRFSPRVSRLRDCTEHLRPIQVLRKVSARDPQEAFRREDQGFFKEVLHKRLSPELVAEEALERAVLYSGGVLRDFFQLLREGAMRAILDELEQITGEVMDDVVVETRRNWSSGIFAPNRQLLSIIRQTHDLPSEKETTFLDRSWVLECYNGDLWYDVHPLLWKLLD